MSIGLRADAGGTSGSVTINGNDKLVITQAGNVTATTFTGALVGNADTATKFAGTTGTAPVYGVRAWVNFDGTKDTTGASSVANTNRLIKASGNVLNVFRNGIGNYTIYFSTPMSSENYAVSIVARSPSSNAPSVGISYAAGAQQATSISIDTITASGSAFIDSDIVTVLIVG